MNLQTWLAVISGLSLVTTAAIAIVGWMTAAQNRRFDAVYARIDEAHGDIKHLDRCLDEWKIATASTMVGRSSLDHAMDNLRREFGVMFAAVDQRLTRLEK